MSHPDLLLVRTLQPRYRPALAPAGVDGPGKDGVARVIGDGKKYASRSVCMEQLRGGIANDLNPYQCPGGIDGAAVEECLSAVVAEECGAHPVEAITRVEKCRNGAMCHK
jgi:Family of unknown function (DUF6184)